MLGGGGWEVRQSGMVVTYGDRGSRVRWVVGVGGWLGGTVEVVGRDGRGGRGGGVVKVVGVVGVGGRGGRGGRNGRGGRAVG